MLAAEEQAHAVEERHARRLTLGIAVAVLLALGAGAGFWIHGDRKERERAARVAKQVRPLMDEVTLLRGQGKWDEALAIAKRVRDLGGQEGDALVAAVAGGPSSRSAPVPRLVHWSQGPE